MQFEGFTDVSVLLKPGIYILCKRGVVIYVGKSKSLYSRIYTHRNLSRKGRKVPSWMPQSVKGIVFDEVHVQYCHVDQIDKLEADTIEKFKPKYNVNLKTGLKSRIAVPLKIGNVVVMLNRPKEEIVRRRCA